MTWLESKNHLIFPKKLLTCWFIMLQTHFVTATPHQAVNCLSVCVFVCTVCGFFSGFDKLTHTDTHTYCNQCFCTGIFLGGVLSTGERDREGEKEGETAGLTGCEPLQCALIIPQVSPCIHLPLVLVCPLYVPPLYE